MNTFKIKNKHGNHGNFISEKNIPRLKWNRIELLLIKQNIKRFNFL